MTDLSSSLFRRRLCLLLDDQQKRKSIIYQIQKVAQEKNYQLHNKPQIVNEQHRYEWFVASDEPTLVDALYYVYFWVLVKGKYLMEDINSERALKMRSKKKSLYQLGSSGSNSNLGSTDSLTSVASSINASSDSLFLELPTKNPISNHNSTTRFEKDILRAKQSVNDLRSQFAKIIDAESSGSTSSEPTVLRRKVTPTSSPISKKFSMNNGSTHHLSHKVSELNLMDLPYIKNVLRFRFEMSTYLGILVTNYELDNLILPLEDIISGELIPTPKILLSEGSINLSTFSRIPGLEHLLFIVENPIDPDCSEHLRFIHLLLVAHFYAGPVWDLHTIYQSSGHLKSSINSLGEEKVAQFQNFDKVLINLIFEFYKDKTRREGLIKEFNMNPKYHTKIASGLKPTYSIMKYSDTWKSWNELDFLYLDNYIVRVDPEGCGNESSKKLLKTRGLLNAGEEITYRAFEGAIVEKQWRKTMN